MSGEDRERLKQQLVEWLEREREAYFRQMENAGIPPILLVSRPIVEDIKGGFSVFDVPKLDNPLMLPDVETALGVSGTILDDNPPATILLETYGNDCFPWQWDSQGRETFLKDRAQWVVNNLLAPTAERYLFRLRRLDKGSTSLAESLADELLRLLETDKLRAVALTPVGGIYLEGTDELSFEFATVRELTTDEKSELALARDVPGNERSRLWRHRGIGLGLMRRPDLFTERYAVVVAAEFAKTVRSSLGHLPARMILALQLLGFDLSGEGTTPNWLEPGPRRSSGGQHVRLTALSNPKPLSMETFQKAVLLAKAVPDKVFVSAQKPPEIALHRFSLAVCEREPSESLIDLVIALEAILLKGIKDELKFRLSLYGAALLEPPGDARLEIYRTLKTIYNTRSDLVHGSPVKPKELPALRDQARELTSRILVKGLTDGWPSKETLESLLLE